MIDLKKDNGQLRAELRHEPPEKLRKILLDLMVLEEKEQRDELAAKLEYRELLLSPGVQQGKDKLSQKVEKVKKVRYWIKVLERSLHPDVPTEEELEQALKKGGSG